MLIAVLGYQVICLFDVLSLFLMNDAQHELYKDINIRSDGILTQCNHPCCRQERAGCLREGAGSAAVAGGHRTGWHVHFSRI